MSELSHSLQKSPLSKMYSDQFETSLKKKLQREGLKASVEVSEACKSSKAETEQIGNGIAEEQKTAKMNNVKWAIVGPIQKLYDVASQSWRKGGLWMYFP